MRVFLIHWLTFLPILAIAVIPAWLGMHYRSFLPYLGFILLFTAVAVIWLLLTKCSEEPSDD